MRINRTNSIKNEFFKSSIIFSLLILIIFVSFFSFFTFNSQIEQAHSAIKQNNKAINFSIEGYVRDLTNLINFLSERSSVRFAYKQDSKKETIKDNNKDNVIISKCEFQSILCHE